ncbi:MAG TPA: hypothetical protein ENJ95_14850 [Bacteroidetes bacterium]|nr:hypothetical protein [Bacteroidota bacterium]
MNEKKQSTNQEAEALKRHLENQFQQLRPQGEMPGSLKKNVFDTLEALRLLSDVFDLFTVKFTKVESTVIGSIDSTSAPADKGEEEKEEDQDPSQ